MSSSLKEVISQLLDFMEEKRALNSLEPPTQEMLDRALEKVIEGTDPKIILVTDYKRKLYKSILKSLDYVDRIIEDIPTPIELNRERFVENPYIRAFFPTLSGLKKVYDHSSELKDYYQDAIHAQSQESYALLCMRKKEETILGMHLVGDRVIRDVKQIRVSFNHHHLLSPAENETDARRELKCCIFEGLVNNALANISEMRANRYHLEVEQQILNSRLRSSRLKGVIPLTGAKQSSLVDQARLNRVEAELEEIGYVTPEVCLEQVNQILSHPEEFVTMKHLSMNLDKAGIKHTDEPDSASCHHFELSEVNIKGLPPRVVTLAKINRADIQAAGRAFP
jgi:hypothetical protein